VTEDTCEQPNAERLTELYPAFRKRVKAVLDTLASQGLRPRIQDAWRSPEDQLATYNSGHSKLKYGFNNVTSRTVHRKPWRSTCSTMSTRPTKAGSTCCGSPCCREARIDDRAAARTADTLRPPRRVRGRPLRDGP